MPAASKRPDEYTGSIVGQYASKDVSFSRDENLKYEETGDPFDPVFAAIVAKNAQKTIQDVFVVRDVMDKLGQGQPPDQKALDELRSSLHSLRSSDASIIDATINVCRKLIDGKDEQLTASVKAVLDAA
jgi:hypothetical protein